MNITTKLFCCALFLATFSASAQVGINNTNPHVSSALDITSEESGILIPRMSETQKNAISTPAKGLLVFQNDQEEGFWYFDGTHWILVGGKGEFISESGVVRNTTDLSSDDFVFGSTTLNNKATSDDDKRFFFDKSKAAFRAGQSVANSWDNSQIGSYSLASGSNTQASGTYSVAMGRETIADASYAVSIGRNNNVTGTNATSFGYLNTASANYSTATGRSNTASGRYSFAGGIANTASGLHSVTLGTTNVSSGENAFTFGRLNTASGLNSVAMGFTNDATNSGAFVFGNESDATGVNAMAIGNNINAPSYSEVAVGIYNTLYTPNSTTATDENDRIFTVGNGFRVGGVTTRNNAFTILKNGQVGIGTDTPSEALEIHGDDNFGGDADFDAHSYGNNITSFHIRSAAGTQANPLAVSVKSNFNFYNMEAQGYDGTGYRNAASIRMGVMANNRTGAGDMPGRIDFHTSSDGTTNNALRMRLDDNGNVGIGTNNAVITEKLVVEGKIKATSINFSGLPTYDTEADAISGGLTTGDLYQTTSGVLRIKQ